MLQKRISFLFAFGQILQQPRAVRLCGLLVLVVHAFIVDGTDEIVRKILLPYIMIRIVVRVFVKLSLHPVSYTHLDVYKRQVYSQWNAPSFLYETMFKTVTPFSFGNAVWYQGESNDSPAEGAVYVSLLGAMIQSWRREDRDEALPFVIVPVSYTHLLRFRRGKNPRAKSPRIP